MSWKDAAQLEGKLKHALNAFNWAEAQEICDGIIERVKTDSVTLPELSARELLHSLRRKRRFELMTQLAGALLQSGLRTPQIRRQYAQALIDLGELDEGLKVLQSIIEDSQVPPKEVGEARGLTGRIYKQRYVNNNDPYSPQNRDNLERALNEYSQAYIDSGKKDLWPGINVVALAERARRDKLPLVGLPDASAIAREILEALD